MRRRRRHILYVSHVGLYARLPWPSSVLSHGGSHRTRRPSARHTVHHPELGGAGITRARGTPPQKKKRKNGRRGAAFAASTPTPFWSMCSTLPVCRGAGGSERRRSLAPVVAAADGSRRGRGGGGGGFAARDRRRLCRDRRRLGHRRGLPPHTPPPSSGFSREVDHLPLGPPARPPPRVPTPSLTSSTGEGSRSRSRPPPNGRARVASRATPPSWPLGCGAEVSR